MKTKKLNLRKWWTHRAQLFWFNHRTWVKPEMLGIQEHEYTSRSDYKRKMKLEESIFNGFTTSVGTVEHPSPPTGESKKGNMLDYVEDVGHAFYETEQSIETTWTVVDNNRVLLPIAWWYRRRDAFDKNYVEMNTASWVVETGFDFSEWNEYPYDANDALYVPIEFVFDGPLRPVLGSPFTHMRRRDWIASVRIEKNDHTYGIEVTLRQVQGTFGWFWLAGRMEFEGQQHYVLFCNELNENGGYKMYVSISVFNKSESRGGISRFTGA